MIYGKPKRAGRPLRRLWNETDAERRKSQIAELWVTPGRHYVGARKVEGHDALERRVRESHEKNVRDNANWFRAADDARRVHDTVVFHWEMLPANEDTVLACGLEFLVVDGSGKIVVDYQFFPA